MDIKLGQFNSGGLSDSPYSGTANSMAEIVGLDLHSKAGIVSANQKLTKISAALVDDLITSIVACTDGLVYFFGSTGGKVWSWNGTTFALATTISAGVLGAMEYQGYIYYATAANLGRVVVGAPTNWALKADTWSAFTNDNAYFHPMTIQNDVLYVGDGYLVAQVDAGVFTADALDIPQHLTITALGRYATDLLIGTKSNTLSGLPLILRWNTWSVSWDTQDTVPDTVNAILEADNYTFVNIGGYGGLYFYNGQSLEPFKTVPGDYSVTATNKVYYNAHCMRDGLLLFGVSSVTGDPCNEGVYSFGSKNAAYPQILTLDYPISQRSGDDLVLTDLQVGAMENVGANMYVAWQNDTTYGVDKLDSTLKLEVPYMSTRVLAPSIVKDTSFKNLSVGYKAMGAGTSITAQSNKDEAGYVAMTLTKDATRKRYDSGNSAISAQNMQYKVILNTTANLTPEITGLNIAVNE